MPKYRYQGNPGYSYDFHPEPLQPGDTVDITAEQAAGAGEDFAPVAAPKSSTTDPEPEEG